MTLPIGMFNYFLRYIFLYLFLLRIKEMCVWLLFFPSSNQNDVFLDEVRISSSSTIVCCTYLKCKKIFFFKINGEFVHRWKHRLMLPIQITFYLVPLGVKNDLFKSSMSHRQKRWKIHVLLLLLYKVHAAIIIWKQLKITICLNRQSYT